LPLLAFASAFLMPAVAFAQSVSTLEEQNKLFKVPDTIAGLSDSVFGEEISYYHGQTEFVQTDVSLPGNFDLPVSVGRRLSPNHEVGAAFAVNHYFKNWELEIPHVHTVLAGISNYWHVGDFGPASTSRCSNFTPPFIATDTDGSLWPAEEYWHGYSLYIPGSGDQQLLQNFRQLGPSSSGYPVVTKNFWVASCIPINNPGGQIQGEGFLFKSPNGTQYKFDQLALRSYQPLVRLGASQATRAGEPPPVPNVPPDGIYSVSRKEGWLLPTEITDRLGNWVRYSYNPSSPWQLTQILAKDGRQLTLTYVSGTNQIQTVSDGTRTWMYTYSNDGQPSHVELSSVILPDGTAWSFDLLDLRSIGVRYPQQFANTSPLCRQETTTPNPRTGRMTHPSGAIGEFTFEARRIGITQAPYSCVTTVVDNQTIGIGYRSPRLLDSPALIRKRITGPGLTPQQWTLAYEQGVGCWATSAAALAREPQNICPANVSTQRSTTITYPDAAKSVYTFGNEHWKSEGDLLATEDQTSTGAMLRRTVQTYVEPNGTELFPNPVGESILLVGDQRNASSLRLVAEQRITQQGIDFVSQSSAFDAYGYATTETESSTLAGAPTRTRLHTFEHRTAPWVLGLRTSTRDQATNVLINETTYHPTTHLPTTLKAFGLLQETRTHHANGPMATVKDANNRVTALDTWERGVPKLITQPDAETLISTVNAQGWITQVTNALGDPTSYGYDPMGRLTSITHPGGDSVVWNNTSLSFAPSPSLAYGLPVGHWKRVSSTGNARTTTHYDALWRPVVVLSEDISDATTKRFVVKRYDARGREQFTSYPVAALSTVDDALPGISSAYDALGRMISSKQDSELGALTTTTNYLSGFRTAVINPRNQTTITEYLAWGEPRTDLPLRIEAPGGMVTTFTRDGFGKPTAVTRSGTYLGNPISAVRRYVYDSNERLCKTIEPESNATIVAYDAANNILWRTQGSNLTTPTCNSGDVPVNERSQFSYDTMNRVTAIDHPVGTDDITYTYFDDGALKTASTPSSTWTYAYNKRRLPTSESLAFDGLNFNIGWSYNANASITALSYPTGLSVAFNPNALGEVAQVGSFATNISYHRNGALAGFTYGNNVVHSTTLSDAPNTRLLPLRSVDVFAGSSIVDTTITYDQNANPTLMSDGVAGAIETKSMTYDGLDRLISATSTGTFGNAIIEYDPLDNIRRYAVNGRDWRYVIDSTTQRLTRINNPAGVQQVGYTHDARGNMTSRNDDGLTLTFNFDRAQRMTDTRYLAQIQQSYRYDAHGRRIESAQPNGDKRYQIYSQSGQLLYEALRPAGSPGVSKTTDYIYLSGTLIAKRAIEDIVVVPVLFKDGFETAALLAQPKYGVRELAPAVVALDPTLPQSNEEQRQQAAALHKTLITTITYLHTDPLGSPVAETNTAGTVIRRNRFEPFGYPLNTPTEGMPSYTGHQYDSYTDLIYAQQRFYDSKAGRFPSIDPLTGIGNRYWYGNNNPYRFVDPDGRQAADTPSRRDLAEAARRQRMIDAGWAISGSGASTFGGCDADECREVQATQRGILRKQGETLIEAGEYAATTTAENWVFGKLLKAIGIGAVFIKTAKRGNSAALGKAMEKIGHIRPPGSAAHYIVAGDDRRAGPARAVLQRFGIDINESMNGVFLPRNVHEGLHTNVYYDDVNRSLRGVNSRSEASNMLHAIRDALANGQSL
jgi:RHS repeat-associated protein